MTRPPTGGRGPLLPRPAPTERGEIHGVSRQTAHPRRGCGRGPCHTNQGAANFDNDGFSYSQQQLSKASLAPGATVSANGLSFMWPGAASGQNDNVQCSGQVVSVSARAGASRLGLLGSAANGSGSGTATITYTDGSTQSFTLSFTDWAVTAQAGNRTVATMPYRNSTSGSSDTGTTVRVFETDVALQSGKTVATVTLPASVSGGQLHVFAVAAG